MAKKRPEGEDQVGKGDAQRGNQDGIPREFVEEWDVGKGERGEEGV